MEFVLLRSGLYLRADAIEKALQLEAQGVRLTARDGLLHLSDGRVLAMTTGLRRHLLALAGECAS